MLLFQISLAIGKAKMLPQWLSGKESTCQIGDVGSILGLGRSPGEGNGNPFQYSCLENPMDRGAWWATVQGVTKNRIQLNNETTTTKSKRSSVVRLPKLHPRPVIDLSEPKTPHP